MGRRAPELEAALTILGPNATAVRGDVTVAADLQRLHDVVAATGKGLDIVFANAGIMEIAASVRSAKRTLTCCSAPTSKAWFSP